MTGLSVRYRISRAVWQDEVSPPLTAKLPPDQVLIEGITELPGCVIPPQSSGQVVQISFVPGRMHVEDLVANHEDFRARMKDEDHKKIRDENHGYHWWRIKAEIYNLKEDMLEEVDKPEVYEPRRAAQRRVDEAQRAMADALDPIKKNALVHVAQQRLDKVVIAVQEADDLWDLDLLAKHDPQLQAAAIRIQAHCRGKRVRNRLKGVFVVRAMALEAQAKLNAATENKEKKKVINGLKQQVEQKQAEEAEALTNFKVLAAYEERTASPRAASPVGERLSKFQELEKIKTMKSERAAAGEELIAAKAELTAAQAIVLLPEARERVDQAQVALQELFKVDLERFSEVVAGNAWHPFVLIVPQKNYFSPELNAMTPEMRAKAIEEHKKNKPLSVAELKMKVTEAEQAVEAAKAAINPKDKKKLALEKQQRLAQAELDLVNTTETLSVTEAETLRIALEHQENLKAVEETDEAVRVAQEEFDHLDKKPRHTRAEFKQAKERLRLAELAVQELQGRTGNYPGDNIPDWPDEVSDIQLIFNEKLNKKKQMALRELKNQKSHKNPKDTVKVTNPMMRDGVEDGDIESALEDHSIMKIVIPRGAAERDGMPGFVCSDRELAVTDVVEGSVCEGAGLHRGMTCVEFGGELLDPAATTWESLLSKIQNAAQPWSFTFGALANCVLLFAAGWREFTSCHCSHGSARGPHYAQRLAHFKTLRDRYQSGTGTWQHVTLRIEVFTATTNARYVT